MNESITLQDFLKIMMIVFINIFLFISEFIISYFYELFNRFGFSLFPPTQFLRGDRLWSPLLLCLFLLFLFGCDFRFFLFISSTSFFHYPPRTQAKRREKYSLL